MIRRLLEGGLGALDARELRWFLNVYPPYLGAGIRVVHAAEDYSRWDVEMRLRRFNRNYFGTHFGGSIYSMCDPFFLLIVTKTLGSGYIVWDESATIRFLRPGRGTLRATFEIARDRIDAIVADVAAHRRCHPVFSAKVVDLGGTTVAEVEKKIYVRRKGPYSEDQ